MKILHVLPTLSAGGAESFITRLCCELQNDSRCEVAIFIPAGVQGERGEMLKEELQKHGVRVFGGESRSMKDWRHIFRLILAIRIFRPDVVQANLYSSEVLCSVVRWLCVFRNIVFVRRLANTVMSTQGRFLMGRYLYLSYDFSIACSQSTYKAYMEHLSYLRVRDNDLNQGKVVTIENGVVVPDNIYDLGEARRKLSLADDSFVVCHIGRFSAGSAAPGGGLASGQKAHDVIIRSFATAYGKCIDNMHLLLVGDGPLRNEAEALANELNLSDRIHFLGVLPNAWQALAVSDLFFFPSRHEGLPNALIEAACFGVPVVASDIPEISTINLAGNWVLCAVDAEEEYSYALKNAYMNIEERRALARQAIPLFRDRFAIEACADRYLELYFELHTKGESIQ